MNISTNTLMLGLLAIAALWFGYAVAFGSGGGSYAAGTDGSGWNYMMGNGMMQGVFGGGSGSGSGGNVAPAGGSGAAAGPVQDVYIHANGGSKYGTYDKQEVRVNANQPVRVHFSADPDAGCGRAFVIYGLDVALLSRSGEEAVAEFTPTKPGAYIYSCSMKMFEHGQFIVV